MARYTTWLLHFWTQGSTAWCVWKGGTRAPLWDKSRPQFHRTPFLFHSQLGCTLATLVCALGRTCTRSPKTQEMVQNSSLCVGSSHAMPVPSQHNCCVHQRRTWELTLTFPANAQQGTHAASNFPGDGHPVEFPATADCTCTQTKTSAVFRSTVQAQKPGRAKADLSTEPPGKRGCRSFRTTFQQDSSNRNYYISCRLG